MNPSPLIPEPREPLAGLRAFTPPREPLAGLHAFTPSREPLAGLRAFKTSRAPAKSRAAFSLVELVVVLAIMGVTAAIAVPRYQASVSSYRARSAALRVAADLDALRRAAISSSRSYRFRAAAGRADYETVDTASGWAGGSVNTVTLSAEPYRASFVAVNLGADKELVFDGYGAPDGVATLTIASGSCAAQVTLNTATGRTTVRSVAKP